MENDMQPRQQSEFGKLDWLEPEESRANRGSGVEEMLPRPPKVPEMDARHASGIRPREMSVMDEIKMERVVHMRGLVDELVRIWLDIPDHKDVDVEIKWDIIDKLIVLSAFIAEAEFPDDPVKQGARNQQLLRDFIELKGPIKEQMVDWFIQKAKLSINQQAKDVEGRYAWPVKEREKAA